jgi:O-antigen ligase
MRRVWAAALLALLAWSALSFTWAYLRDDYPGLAINTTLQYALVALFALALASARPPLRAIALTLVTAALVYGAIGVLQVARQGPVGLDLLGEFPLNPARSGVSVIQSGDLRWLRPYGLSSHPNVLGGFLAIATLAAGGLSFAERGRLRWFGTAAALFCLWCLLLTFSRGAWLGFAAGAVAVLPLVWRGIWTERAARRHLLVLAALALIVGAVFVGRYHPLLLTRAGVGSERLEQQSIAERVIFNNVAFVAIERYPLQGVGAGNFPWFSSYYLFYETDIDHRGENVHNVFLLVTAELGVIGLLLMVAVVLSAIGRALPRSGDALADWYRAVFLGGAVALIVIGLFDHYPWSLLGMQVLWWGLLVVSGSSKAFDYAKQ